MGLGAGCAVVALTILATVAKLKLKTLATRKTDAFLLILFFHFTSPLIKIFDEE